MTLRAVVCLLCVLAAGPSRALAQTGATIANDAPQPGDTVRIETATGAIEGLLVDKVPDGYLIKTSAGQLVITYTNVRSIRRTSLRAGEITAAGKGQSVATLQAQVAQPGLGVALRDDLPVIGRPSPVEIIGLQSAVGIGTWQRQTLVGPVKPASQVSVGFDIELPVNRFVTIQPEMLFDWSWSATLPNGYKYRTHTILSSLWVRPYLRGGPVRFWAGAGGAFAVLKTGYKAPGALEWDNAYAHSFGLVYGAGIETYVVGGQVQTLIVGLSLEMGTPENVKVGYHQGVEQRLVTFKDSGPMVNPTRLVFSIAFGADAARVGPADPDEAIRRARNP